MPLRRKTGKATIQFNISEESKTKMGELFSVRSVSLSFTSTLFANLGKLKKECGECSPRPA